jgi:class 3 adenylate cyclase
VLGRTVSALEPDRKSVLAEIGFAGLQVWQSVSEKAGRGRGSQEMAVMFTDLAGFSSWALKAGPACASACTGAPRASGDYLGVDVNIAARVSDAPKPGQLLVSEELLARIDPAGLRTGRAKRLRADGAPRDLHVVRVSRD